MSCFDDDFNRIHLESARLDEEVIDDEVDSHASNGIESESYAESPGNHGLVEKM